MDANRRSKVASGQHHAITDYKSVTVYAIFQHLSIGLGGDLAILRSHCKTVRYLSGLSPHWEGHSISEEKEGVFRVRDRFVRGVLAGVAGVVGKDIVDLSARYLFHFSKNTFWDFNSILILGRPPSRIMDYLVAQAGEVTLSVTLGLVFVYLVSHLMSSRRLLFKSTLYSVASWYFLYATTSLFKVQGLVKVATETAVTHFFSTAAFGLSLGLALQYMNRRKAD